MSRFAVTKLKLSTFRIPLFVPLVLAMASPLAVGQETKVADTKPAAKPEFIPVTDPLTVAKCGTCHTVGADGNMSRISAIRTTPEGWEEAIKRMVRLNGLQLTPDDARKILRYLSDAHGLAPEEAARVEYFLEHRQIDEKMPDADVQHACASCHALAKPLSWRRTPEDWDLLKNMHVAFFPSIDSAFRRPGAGGVGGRAEAAAPTADGVPPKQPVDLALAYMKKSQVLLTPEWSNWTQMTQVPNLKGTWLVKGKLPGRGLFYGKMTVQDKLGGNEFGTHTDLKFVNGETWSGAGNSLVYTGYSWRGHTTGGAKLAGIDAPGGVREVMLLSKDHSQMTGRWFWGTYQEFGLDVILLPETNSAVVLGLDTESLKAGLKDAPVRIFGANFPATVAATDIAMGPGVTVSKIVSSTPDTITLTVDVDPHAVPGLRAVSVGIVSAPAAYAVYDHMDFVKVLPVTGIARLGSEPHAKGYMQFDAVAYANGPDGKPDTADDIPLGSVPAEWKLEEFVASYGDDDINFVGQIDGKSGFFTPASDGPNPQRKSMRNNYGDVWVVASYKEPGSEKPLVGRGYFIIAVPQYIQWDQPEVGQ